MHSAAQQPDVANHLMSATPVRGSDSTGQGVETVAHLHSPSSPRERALPQWSDGSGVGGSRSPCMTTRTRTWSLWRLGSLRFRQGWRLGDPIVPINERITVIPAQLPLSPHEPKHAARRLTMKVDKPGWGAVSEQILVAAVSGMGCPGNGLGCGHPDRCQADWRGVSGVNDYRFVPEPDSLGARGLDLPHSLRLRFPWAATPGRKDRSLTAPTRRSVRMRRRLIRQDGCMIRDPAEAVVLTVGGRDRELEELLDERIYAFNVAATGFADGQRISIRADNGVGRFVGGLSGWAWGGCGYVNVLWVADDHRRQGIGTRLMDAAEAVALAGGCVTMALSTHTFQAPAFYQRRGYIEIGRTPDYPRGHAQVHMRKSLIDTNAAN